VVLEAIKNNISALQFACPKLQVFEEILQAIHHR